MFLMKQLKIIFSRPISKYKPYADLIMWYDGTDFDHAAIDFNMPDWDLGMIYQSSGLKTNFMGQKYFQSINIIKETYVIELDPISWKRVAHVCWKREGRPYGIPEVLGKMIICTVFMISGGKIRMKNPFKSADTDCITEVAYVLANALRIQTPLDMDTVTVKPFRDWVASLPQVRKLA